MSKTTFRALKELRAAWRDFIFEVAYQYWNYLAHY